MSQSKNKKTKLRTLRKKAGLTQRELSERGGMGFRTVGSWERGNTHPDLENLGKLAYGLQLPLKEVLASFDVDVSGIPNDVPQEVFDLLNEIPELLEAVESKAEDELLEARINLAKIKIKRFLQSNKGKR